MAAAAALSCGRRDSVKSSVATQCTPMKGSRSCFVRDPNGSTLAPMPALFHRTSSLVSWAAKAAAAAVTDLRSFRSRWRNLRWPLPGLFDCMLSLIVLMAASALSCGWIMSIGNLC